MVGQTVTGNDLSSEQSLHNESKESRKESKVSRGRVHRKAGGRR